MLLISAFALLASLPSTNREELRLKTHFDVVLAELAAANTDGIPASAQRARSKHIQVLRAYRDAAQFPINLHLAKATPIFIDEGGQLCAVGHLLIEDGHIRLAEAIQASENLARLPNMQHMLEIRAWADTNGLTVAELTRIQPSYAGECLNADPDCVVECCTTDDERCSTNFGIPSGATVCGDDGVSYATTDIAESCGASVADRGACRESIAEQLGCQSNDAGWNLPLVGLLALWRRPRAKRVGPGTARPWGLDA
jgi:hypothetical protein